MYKKILFATDLLEEHNHFLEKAVSLAKQMHASLYLLHVIELPTSYQLAQGLGFAEIANPARDDARFVLSTIGEHYNISQTQLIVEVGSVKEHIFNTVKQLQCQLIIIGRQSSINLHSFLGSTAHATVNHAPCDVLTIA